MHDPFHLKEKAKLLAQKSQTYGFWVLLLIGFGGYLGVCYANLEVNKRIDDSIKLGGYLYKGKVYDITVRAGQ